MFESGTIMFLCPGLRVVAACVDVEGPDSLQSTNPTPENSWFPFSHDQLEKLHSIKVPLGW